MANAVPSAFAGELVNTATVTPPAGAETVAFAADLAAITTPGSNAVTLEVEGTDALVVGEIRSVQAPPRRGKAPARVVKQRFKEQILHDVAHDLIPRAVDDALRARGVEPVSTPDVASRV